MKLTVNNANPTAMKQSVLRNEINQYEMVDLIASILTQHYKSELDGILNFLMVKEAILSIHGQTRKDLELAAFYALELLEKAKLNKLNLTFDARSQLSALQFELPRLEYTK
ncbi:hypothetical protein [Vibrio harveyi]|uniref:hypothetical protein n=1 Tax=Vibrio harveyi TaxID=669 RepID=UPI0025B09B47|nr:hypothetical protein [Vibrio harveyi]WJT11033.1 hypothetical protein PH545_28970 [Vibrio harveyi]